MGRSRGRRSEVSSSLKNLCEIPSCSRRGNEAGSATRGKPRSIPPPIVTPHAATEGKTPASSGSTRRHPNRPIHARTPLTRIPRTIPVPCGYALTSAATGKPRAPLLRKEGGPQRSERWGGSRAPVVTQVLLPLLVRS